MLTETLHRVPRMDSDCRPCPVRLLLAYEFHHEERTRELQSYTTIAEAAVACRQLVDGVLLKENQPGVWGHELYDRYVQFGLDVYIEANLGAPVFSGYDYAKKRCHQICGTW